MNIRFAHKKALILSIALFLIISFLVVWYFLNFYSKATTQDYLGYKMTFCDDVLGDNTNRKIIAFSGETIVSEKEYPQYEYVVNEFKRLALPKKYRIKEIISLLQERKELAPRFKEATDLAWEKYSHVCFFCDDEDFAKGIRQSTEAEWEDFISYTQPLRKRMYSIDKALFNAHESIFNYFKEDLGVNGVYMCKDEEGLRELFIRN